jgi:UMF1 family MFS transporter
MGYVGGLAAMLLAMVALVSPEIPWFGISKVNGANIRATNLLVAAWFAVFAIPPFLVLKETTGSSGAGIWSALTGAGKQLVQTLREVRRYRQVGRLLLARMIYNDGLTTIFAFGGIYAMGTFGFSFPDIMIFGIVMSIGAGAGAFLAGSLDDLWGGKWTIMVSIVGLLAAILLALLTTSKTGFWVAGIMIGLMSGPNQSASRSLMGRFTPPRYRTEFFGFYAFSGKATAFLGPLLLGILTEAFQSQRAGISVVALLFAVGGWILWRVDEEEGIRVAGEG